MTDLLETNDGISRSRERIIKNGEVFTPECIIEQMVANVPQEDWSNPTKTFLDPTCGNGQILCYILKKRLEAGVSKKDAVSTLFGIELMEDNAKLCRKRLADILETHEFEDIINNNIVCSDIFWWNIEKWEPRKEKILIKHKNVFIKDKKTNSIF